MIGIDIIEIERIRAAIEQHGEHFLNRLFTPAEQEYCNKHADPATSYAGRFAAKEAIAKALGTGFGAHLSWLDLEILPDSSGKPSVTLRGSPSDIALSIAHCKAYATATALHT